MSSNLKNEPIVEEGVIDVKAQSLNVATQPVEGLKMYSNYLVKVYIYEDKEETVLLDQLTQEVKSYVDTRNGRLLIDKELSQNMGQELSKVME